MSTKFVSSIYSASNMTKTTNGADAKISTGSELLNLYGQIGALRSRSDDEVERLFIRALSEDKLLATRMMFYARNIRGGLGERKVFRTMLRFMANNYPEIVIKNICLISNYGREDDILVLLDTQLKNIALEYIKRKLEEDCKNAGIVVPWKSSKK